ncbi:MAG: M20 family metallo-hydrolase [Bacteroidota bacterium]
MQELTSAAIALLKSLIQTPSLSRQEIDTAAVLSRFFSQHHIPFQQQGYNLWAKNQHWQDGKPVILLNSHHDTVKPNPSWQRDPFHAGVEGDQLFGLGSNDAGGPLVSLIATFVHFYPQPDLPFNLLIAATAEEEISGPNGIASILDRLGPIDLGIIGEPTEMHLAIAEKGLMVLDGIAKGVAGHAAREEGVNAIYEALEDIAWFGSYQFEKVSDFLGPVKMSLTQIKAGSQHNVVPDQCSFVVDVRTNELYSNQEVFEIIQQHTQSKMKARSFRLNSSRLDPQHPLVQKGLAMGRKTYGSPTLSDQALIPYPTLKMGPGDSARSHTADEYIRLSEIAAAIPMYIELLSGLELGA